MFNWLWLVPAFPLLGVVTNLIFRSRSERRIGGVASGVVGLSFLCTAAIFSQLLSLDPGQRLIEKTLYHWIAAGSLQTTIGFQIDPLSMVMMLVVTGVSFVIHLYAVGYMHGDPGFRRFFIYLNLFVLAMLILVMADNFLMMFIGWEGVGLCSYLLIGFWYGEDQNAYAGRKAFIVNRIGDFGFLLAIFLIFITFGTLDFTSVFSQAASRFSAGSGIMTTIALLLFVGAAGKSAQVPLYVWLPDAMAGPTPVSALIHAATMVTAGVYMVARANILYTLAPAAAMVVAATGAFTALYAAIIGLTQFDIKRVLAYSTVSQLGYMFIGVGVGAYAAGVFHLMTHAFFKALLFMAAGSVIHALGNTNDLRQMGGLRKYMPITYWTMLLATLAISGIPGFSGFFSKDEILWSAFSSARGGWWIWFIGAAAAGLTTFYMFRLIFLTFHGQPRMNEKIRHHLHESPRIMTLPLVILAILSVVGGYVGIPAVFGGHHRFENFLAPVFEQSEHLLSRGHGIANEGAMEWRLIGVVLLLVIFSLWLAWTFYLRKTDLPARTARRMGALYRLILNKYYIDEIYDALICRPLRRLSETVLWRGIDSRVIDGAVNGAGEWTRRSGAWLSRTQNGLVQTYALIFVAGVAFILFFILY